MKLTKEIIGLRVISVMDGTQLGSVKEVVINAQEKSIDFLMMDQPTDILGAKVIPFADILGIGEFAVTIPGPNVIQDVVQCVEAKDLLLQDIKVIGTKVLTKKGQLIGEVTELSIDEESGRVAACLFESQGQMYQAEVGDIITFGKELLIIEEMATGINTQVNTQNAELQTDQERTPDVSLKNSDIVADKENDVTENAEPKVESQFEPQIAAKVESSVTPKPVGDKEEVALDPKPETNFNLFEQRQLQYFIGKKVEKDIVLDNAEILRAGEQITPEIVDNITTKTTLMEVSSHLQKN